MNPVLKAFEARLASTNWDQFFLKLELSSGPFSTSEAKSDCNRDLNRYHNVLPYNHSRIVLRGSGHRDYINASSVYAGDRQYILTQGPLERTVEDVWQMVWQERVRNIVMLCRTVENRVEKCCRYWPDAEIDDDDVLSCPSYGLEVRAKSVVERKNYILRTLLLNESRQRSSPGGLGGGRQVEIQHFQYMTWPDFGVPDNYEDFLEFLDDVNSKSEDKSCLGPPPTLVHCSAGLGRSGSFVLIDSCLDLFRKNKTLDFNAVQNVLTTMRQRRGHLIQTQKQLQFSFYAIHYGMKKIVEKEQSKTSATATSSPDDDDDDVSGLVVVNNAGSTSNKKKRPTTSPLEDNNKPENKRHRNSDSGPKDGC